jgi:hypothetical protein
LSTWQVYHTSIGLSNWHIAESAILLPRAGAIGLMAAALLAAWGLFVRWNKSVEEMEPEALERAHQEDEKVEC